MCQRSRAHADAGRYDGKWVITSNDDTLTVEDLALGYKQLLRVEQCWRQLKSGLRMRPVFHYRPWRIHAHVTISVIALLLERIVELRTGDTWRNVCAALGRVQVVEYERAEVRVQQTTEIAPEVERLLRQLKVGSPPKLHGVAAADRGNGGLETRADRHRVGFALALEAPLVLSVEQVIGAFTRNTPCGSAGVSGVPRRASRPERRAWPRRG